jgi:hypothetical protein
MSYPSECGKSGTVHFGGLAPSETEENVGSSVTAGKKVGARAPATPGNSAPRKNKFDW